MTDRPSVLLVSRELYPFTGGGIAPMVAATATLLAEVADVTIMTTAVHRAEYERLRAADPKHERLPDPAVRLEFVEEPGPDDLGGYLSHMHGWSARVFERLCDLYPGGGPDLVEFPDYLAEGFVTVQARAAGDPRVGRTTVCMRAYTTSEIVSVLNGRVTDDFASRAVWEAERYCLANCDRFVHPGGDVYGTYARFYGAHAMAPAHRARHAVFSDIEPTHTLLYGADEIHHRPLRLLYFGRMERRKGVHNLLRAARSLDRDDWTLALLGGDTHSAPLRNSMRDYLATLADGDERVIFADPIPRWEVAEVIKSHDIVAIPSLWECWPNTSLEALCVNRPVLGTPVGGLREIVEPRVSGWLAESSDWRAVAREFERLLDAREEVVRLAEFGGPLKTYGELTDRDEIIESYLELIGSRSTVARARPRSGPLVSVVVPYYQLDKYIEDTLQSVAAQTYSPIETVIVNDGSLRGNDAVLVELADRYGAKLVTHRNAGLGAARNFGISQAAGEYIVPLDADDRIAPTFVERCVQALEGDSTAAYATTWSAYMKPDGTPYGDGIGWAPFGNWSELVSLNNVAGTCTSAIRRRFFDQGFAYSDELTSYEDWFLYRELHDAGHYGVVLPERLIEYRVRPESMLRQIGSPSVATIYEEMNAHLRERAVKWEAGSL
ncbi:MAG: glycosyltransferase [Thermoleophilaceae bacterium]